MTILFLLQAHCICQGSSPTRNRIKAILSNGSSKLAARVFRNPNCKFNCANDGPNRCDAAVLEFDENVVEASVAIPIYEGNDEVGKTIEIFGYGLTGPTSSFTKNCRAAEEDGRFRTAENVVTSANGVVSSSLLFSLFANNILIFNVYRSYASSAQVSNGQGQRRRSPPRRHGTGW